MSAVSFPDNNLSNYQWIFTKLGMYIDIIEASFRIANAQISLIFHRVICPQHISGGILSFHFLYKTNAGL